MWSLEIENNLMTQNQSVDRKRYKEVKQKVLKQQKI